MEFPIPKAIYIIIVNKTKELKDFIFDAVIIFLSKDFKDSFFCILGNSGIVCFVPKNTKKDG